MRKLKVGFMLLLLIIFTTYALAFAVSNNQALALDFLLGSPISLPAAIWIAITLGIGLLLGLAGGAFSNAKHKLRIRQLQKQLKHAQSSSGSF